jgi:Fe2+ or Zn2+ uptake regulation protein
MASEHTAAMGRMLGALKQRGLKLTPQRFAIIRSLADDPTHPTAQELFARLRPDLPTMSFATVYNTLSALTDAGLCASRALTPGPARFDPNCTPHDHAVCDACGKVADVPAPGSGAQPPTNFQVRTIERIYRGLCSDCLARPAAHATTKGD